MRSCDAGANKWFISGLTNRTETFALIDHLHRYPVSYTRVVKKQRRGANISTEQERALLMAGATAVTPASNNNSSNNSSSTNTNSTSSSSTAGADLKQRLELLEKVDVQTSSEAVKLVHQIRELAADTLAELNDQASTIDEMAGDMDRINAATKKGEQHAKAVDSVVAAMSSDNSELKEDIQRRMGERTKIDIRERPEATVPVLWKHKSDLLSRAELVLNRDNFYFVDLRDAAAAQRKKLRKPEPYTNIACLIARARPYHVDVRLSKGTRIRFMSARIQTAITELAMRAELPSEAIVFEPLVRKFGVDGIVNDVEDVVIEESESDDNDDNETDGAANRHPDPEEDVDAAGAGRAARSARRRRRRRARRHRSLVCATESEARRRRRRSAGGERHCQAGARGRRDFERAGRAAPRGRPHGQRARAADGAAGEDERRRRRQQRAAGAHRANDRRHG